jgi:hypothetical protein
MGTIAPSKASTTAVTMMRGLSMCASLRFGRERRFRARPAGQPTVIGPGSSGPYMALTLRDL